ncbi:endolytic transglycosylase MltG [Syntrophomonas curvata]
MMEIKVKQPRKNKGRMLIIFIVLLTISGFCGSRFVNLQYLPVDANNKTPIDVFIPAASSARQVAAILEEHQLIRSQSAFLSYCRKEKLDVQLKPGHYSFNRSLSLAQIAHSIAEGRVVKIKVTVPEGYTVKEIGAMLMEKGVCTEESWQEAIKADYPYEFLQDVPASSKYRLEGFLFPDTYYIEENTSSREIISMMLENFVNLWNQEFAAQAKAENMNVYDTVILASLIEEEAMHDDERGTISGVIKNRLRDGMYLQLCPTVLYCFDQKKTKLNNADLEVNSPYNTYRNPGLPPGPISSPGRASIAAALNPEKHPYYFYVSKGDGSHYFSRTYEEHLRAMSRYIK